MPLKVFKSFILSLVIISPLVTLAEDATPEVRAVNSHSELKPHFSFSAGAGEPSGERELSPNYAIGIGFQPIIPISIKAQYNYADYSEDSGRGRLLRNSLLLDLAYNFGGNIPLIKYSYVGFGIGAVFQDTDTDDDLLLGLKPQMGFDYPVEDILDAPFSLGANVAMTFVSSNSPDELNVSGVVKYWY